MSLSINGCLTYVLQNCSSDTFFGLTMTGKLFVIPPWENYIEESSKFKNGIHNPIGRLISSLDVSKNIEQGFPIKKDNTIKIIVATPERDEKGNVFNNFSESSIYKIDRYKDKKYIPIIEMNMVISKDLMFLKKIVSQFSSGAEAVKAMLEGVLHTYDGLTFNIINCSTHTYYTVVNGVIVKIPGPKDVVENDYFDLKFTKSSSEEYTRSVLKEFGISDVNIEKGWDIFLVSIFNNDFPRRSITIDNLPDEDKTYYKDFYAVKWDSGSYEGNMKPILLDFTYECPIFRNLEAAKFFLEEFGGSMRNYYITLTRKSVNKRMKRVVGKVKTHYENKEKGVTDMTKRFIKTSLFDRGLDFVTKSLEGLFIKSNSEKLFGKKLHKNKWVRDLDDRFYNGTIEEKKEIINMLKAIEEGRTNFEELEYLKGFNSSKNSINSGIKVPKDDSDLDELFSREEENYYKNKFNKDKNNSYSEGLLDYVIKNGTNLSSEEKELILRELRKANNEESNNKTILGMFGESDESVMEREFPDAAGNPYRRKTIDEELDEALHSDEISYREVVEENRKAKREALDLDYDPSMFNREYTNREVQRIIDECEEIYPPKTFYGKFRKLMRNKIVIRIRKVLEILLAVISAFAVGLRIKRIFAGLRAGAELASTISDLA